MRKMIEIEYFNGNTAYLVVELIPYIVSASLSHALVCVECLSSAKDEPNYLNTIHFV